MKTFIAVTMAGASAALDDVTFKFMQYIATQNKFYSSIEEFNMRLSNFSKIDEFI